MKEFSIFSRLLSGLWRAHPIFIFTLFMMTSLPSAEPPPPGVVVELRAAPTAGDPESRTLSCVVTNRSAAPISTWKGYDGEHHRVVSQGLRFPVELAPAKKPALEKVTIPPGQSETIFALPIEDIFFLRPEKISADWRWGWAPPCPRSMPPVSPFHGSYNYGWEVRRAESATVSAEVEADGEGLVSPPLEIHAKKLRLETVRALARLQSARCLDGKDRQYEVTLEVRQALEGVLTPEERTFLFPCGDGEHVLAEAGARLDEARQTYVFAGPSMIFTFSRVLAEDGHPLRLVMTGYEKVDEPAGPLGFVGTDGAILIAAADVRSYEWRTHTIHLRPGVLTRLREKLAGQLAGGVPFTLRLGEVSIYPGVFTTALSSHSQSLPTVLLDGQDSAPIQLGYPSPEHFHGEDPRPDPRLKAALRTAKLLHK